MNDNERTEIFSEYCKEPKLKNLKSGRSIKGKFEIGGQYHYYLETQCALSVPTENGIDLYCSTHWMDLIQVAVAEALNISNNQINMQVRRLGGGFGGKISRPAQLACATSIAAHFLKRPVRMVLTMEDNMNIIGKRLPVINQYSVDVDENGKILALDTTYYEDYGCSYNEPAYLTTGFIKNCYNDDYFKITATRSKTDTASNTWCRGPGTLDGICMIENIMEHISRKLKIEPLKIRINNIPNDSPMKKYLIDFAESTDYYKRKSEIEEFNSVNRWRKRGIAIAPIRFHIEYFGSLHAFVSISHRDGTVSVSVGGIEMGQGLNTKVAQTAAHILEIPLEKIIVKPSNNMTSVNDTVTGASIGSEISSFATQKACEILKERLKKLKDGNIYIQWEDLIQKAYVNDLDLTASYMYKSSDIKEYYVYGASCCEILVDILTGNVLVKRVDIMEDVGESMSPGIDLGQIEGGFIMGLGYWLMESLVYNESTGELLTNRSWNYKTPGAKDIPIDFRVTLLRNSTNPFGVLRSKGKS